MLFLYQTTVPTQKQDSDERLISRTEARHVFVGLFGAGGVRRRSKFHTHTQADPCATETRQVHAHLCLHSNTYAVLRICWSNDAGETFLEKLFLVFC